MNTKLLKKIRLANGVKAKELADELDVTYFDFLRMERGLASYLKIASKASNDERQMVFKRYIKALRRVIKHKAIEASEKMAKHAISKPKGATHCKEGEWVRVVVINGNKRGFRRVDGEWVRSSWVEKQLCR